VKVILEDVAPPPMPEPAPMALAPPSLDLLDPVNLPRMLLKSILTDYFSDLVSACSPHLM